MRYRRRTGGGGDIFSRGDARHPFLRVFLQSSIKKIFNFVAISVSSFGASVVKSTLIRGNDKYKANVPFSLKTSNRCGGVGCEAKHNTSENSRKLNRSACYIRQALVPGCDYGLNFKLAKLLFRVIGFSMVEEQGRYHWIVVRILGKIYDVIHLQG